jgi:hypothetical protein
MGIPFSPHSRRYYAKHSSKDVLSSYFANEAIASKKQCPSYDDNNTRPY